MPCLAAAAAPARRLANGCVGLRNASGGHPCRKALHPVQPAAQVPCQACCAQAGSLHARPAKRSHPSDPVPAGVAPAAAPAVRRPAGGQLWVRAAGCGDVRPLAEGQPAGEKQPAGQRAGGAHSGDATQVRAWALPAAPGRVGWRRSAGPGWVPARGALWLAGQLRWLVGSGALHGSVCLGLCGAIAHRMF